MLEIRAGNGTFVFGFVAASTVTSPHAAASSRRVLFLAFYETESRSAQPQASTHAHLSTSHSLHSSSCVLSTTDIDAVRHHLSDRDRGNNELQPIAFPSSLTATRHLFDLLRSKDKHPQCQHTPRRPHPRLRLRLDADYATAHIE